MLEKVRVSGGHELDLHGARLYIQHTKNYILTDRLAISQDEAHFCRRPNSVRVRRVQKRFSILTIYVFHKNSCASLAFLIAIS